MVGFKDKNRDRFNRRVNEESKEELK